MRKQLEQRKNTDISFGSDSIKMDLEQGMINSIKSSPLSKNQALSANLFALDLPKIINPEVHVKTTFSTQQREAFNEIPKSETM